MTDNPFLNAALAYSDLGWKVVPLEPREKFPRLKDWQNLGSDDPGQISRWWYENPQRNVGILLGSPSGLIGIDVDSDEGSKMLAEMAGNELPDTLEMITGKGSRLLFAIPDHLEVEPRQKCDIMGSDGKEALRIQGKGGQCVMPPSVHPGDAERGIPPGRIYAWVEGRSPDDIQPAPMPSWLIAETCRPERPESADPPRPREEGTPWGECNKQNWEPCLIKWGFKPAGGRGEVRYYTRPGKDRGVSVSVGHCKASDGTPAMYVFSGSIPELPAGKSYDLFGAWARYECAGEFDEAARRLIADGIGQSVHKRTSTLEQRVTRLEHENQRLRQEIANLGRIISRNGVHTA